MSEFNYFNYFTEIDEYFWQKRGAHLLVSPLDWSIVETWQKAGISLPAVLRGIDRAFESYARSRRAAGGRQLKSLAYCVDAVLEAADEEKETAAGTGPVAGKSKSAESKETFSRNELRAFLTRNSEKFAAQAEALRANPGIFDADRFTRSARPGRSGAQTHGHGRKIDRRSDLHRA